MWTTDSFLVEYRLRHRAIGYFGRHLDQPRVRMPTDLWRFVDGYRAQIVSDEDWEAMLSIDFLVRGFLRNPDGTRHEQIVAVDASLEIDAAAVERAHTSASILRRVGYDARAAVGAPAISPEGEKRAAELDVQVVVAEYLGDY